MWDTGRNLATRLKINTTNQRNKKEGRHNVKISETDMLSQSEPEKKTPFVSSKLQKSNTFQKPEKKRCKREIFTFSIWTVVIQCTGMSTS